MRQIAVIGTPMSASFLLEWGLFSSAALLMGMISTTALAAHQIALQVTAILFMIPLGIGMAATVRVGQAIGAGDPEGVRRAGQVAIWLGIAIGVAQTVAVIVLRFAIARLFLGENLPNIDVTIALAAQLLLIGGTFYVTDGLQGIAVGALRGMNDTRVPLLIAAVSYWAIGFCSAYMMAFHTPLGASGVWIGLSLGTLVYATLLVLRFRLLARRLAA
jgi:MATE family multidrug resistance protein